LYPYQISIGQRRCGFPVATTPAVNVRNSQRQDSVRWEWRTVPRVGRRCL